ncbi:hypothetical protein ACFWNN_40025 [Lentzea sp. NPDC058450]|uniref:hypothetical protein n=1 Tax=Lentzea sp. NPDC058450 TaxID=3346505 RepID=UPI0036497A1C
MTLRNQWLHVGGHSYVLDLHDTDLATVVAHLKNAVQNNALVEISVLDERDRVVTLYLNGGLVDSFVVDENKGPRPHEIS